MSNTYVEIGGCVICLEYIVSVSKLSKVDRAYSAFQVSLLEGEMLTIEGGHTDVGKKRKALLAALGPIKSIGDE